MDLAALANTIDGLVNTAVEGGYDPGNVEVYVQSGGNLLRIDQVTVAQSNVAPPPDSLPEMQVLVVTAQNAAPGAGASVADAREMSLGRG